MLIASCSCYGGHSKAVQRQLLSVFFADFPMLLQARTVKKISRIQLDKALFVCLVVKLC
jgi:hypothetical protein